MITSFGFVRGMRTRYMISDLELEKEDIMEQIKILVSASRTDVIPSLREAQSRRDRLEFLKSHRIEIELKLMKLRRKLPRLAKAKPL